MQESENSCSQFIETQSILTSFQKKARKIFVGASVKLERAIAQRFDLKICADEKGKWPFSTQFKGTGQRNWIWSCCLNPASRFEFSMRQLTWAFVSFDRHPQAGSFWDWARLNQ
jgi:hypothetical protein